jgi:hypothetical protein
LFLGGTAKRLLANTYFYLEMNMKIDDNYLLDNKLDYLKLTLKISKLRYHGDEPPEELLQQAYEIGKLVGVSEMELKNICSNP